MDSIQVGLAIAAFFTLSSMAIGAVLWKYGLRKVWGTAQLPLLILLMFALFPAVNSPCRYCTFVPGTLVFLL